MVHSTLTSTSSLEGESDSVVLNQGRYILKTFLYRRQEAALSITTPEFLVPNSFCRPLYGNFSWHLSAATLRAVSSFYLYNPTVSL